MKQVTAFSLALARYPLKECSNTRYMHCKITFFTLLRTLIPINWLKHLRTRTQPLNGHVPKRPFHKTGLNHLVCQRNSTTLTEVVWYQHTIFLWWIVCLLTRSTRPAPFLTDISIQSNDTSDSLASISKHGWIEDSIKNTNQCTGYVAQSMFHRFYTFVRLLH